MSSSLPRTGETTDAPLDYVLDAFQQRFEHTSNVHIAQAPGRVNLIGDHTDYNDGFVLPMTIDRAVYVALRKRDDDSVRLHSLNFEEEVQYSLEAPHFDAETNWASYAMGVADALRRQGGLDSGFEGVIYGDVPRGSGLSSSAALEVGMCLALDAAFSLEIDPVDAARLCQQVEHEYAGVECGIMDQFTSRLGRSGHALFLDCRDLSYRHISIPLEDIRIVIVDSNTSRALASSKYNERRTECEEAVSYFQSVDSSVTALRDVSCEMMESHGSKLPPVLQRRSRHVITENARVVEGCEHLAHDRVRAFGTLMNASHQSLRDDFEVTTPTLDRLVTIAQETDGVLGARMTGAGFGGCTVNLVRPSAVAPLKERIHTRFNGDSGHEPAIYVLESNFEAKVL